MRKVLIVLPVLALSLAAPATAAPNFFGTTGLIRIPTADVLADRSYNVHVHGLHHLTTYGANFGVTGSLEGGLTAFDPSNASTRLFGNLKYQFLKETSKAPSIAVGVVDIADTVSISGYGIVSKSFPLGQGRSLRAHIGYGGGLFSDNVIGGADFSITNNISLMGEYDGDDVNFGGRIGLGRGVRVDLAVLNGDFGAGLSYAAGF
jgi:Exopolysaccharide biosynthesis protein YbjH